MSENDIVILAALWWLGGYSLACWAWHLRYQQMVWSVRLLAAVAAVCGPMMGIQWAIMHCAILHREWLDAGPRDRGYLPRRTPEAS